MTDRHFHDRAQRNGDYIVRAPRLGDAIGQTLKNVYPIGNLPSEMRALVSKLDQILH